MSEADGSLAPRRIALIGAPIDMGASQRGTLMGPAALRTAGLVTVLDSLGFEVTDDGDVSVADMADLADPPPGCRFHPRCPLAMEVCSHRVPSMIETAPGHRVACFAVNGDEQP